MKNPEPISVVVIANAPKLTTGDDASIGKELIKLFNEAQNGMRRVVAFGLLAWEVKQKLKHGQFGSWLAAHAPKLCRPDSKNGKPKTTHALESYMTISKGVLESCGLSIAKYIDAVPNSPTGGISGGKLLLLAEKKIPEALRPLREKICSLVDGKTQKQVLMEFKQVEEDEGGIKKKHGRLKGKGGASAAQRAAAKKAQEDAEVTAANLWAEETGEYITENADDAHWGARLEDKTAAALLEHFETAVDYLKRLVANRKNKARP